MTLALSRVRRNPYVDEPISTFHHRCRQRFCTLGDITLEGVKNSSKGSGATPAGSLARPHGTSTIKYSLHSSASAQIETRGLLSRISVRGTSTDVHAEIVHTQIEASHSTPCPVARTVVDDRNLEDGKGVERINQSSSVGYCRIRKQYGSRPRRYGGLE